MGDDKMTRLSTEVANIKETLDAVESKVDYVSVNVERHLAKEEVQQERLDDALTRIDERLDIYNAQLAEHMARTKAVEITNERLATLVEKIDARLVPIEEKETTKRHILSFIKWTVGVLAGVAAIAGFLVKFL